MTHEQRLTPATLEAIRKRAEKATEGPWIRGVTAVHGGSPKRPITNIPRAQDIEFIAHARQDIPALLAEVERLRNSIEWYANPSNYTANETSCDGLPAIDNDIGEIARIALGGER